MLNELIATVQQLAAAFRKYKGIVFTYMEGNIKMNTTTQKTTI